MDIARALIREPDVGDAAAYRRRVHRLAAVYLLQFGLAIAGLVLLVSRARLLIILTQRSNVETLTIAFFLLFFAYLASLSARGARGALRIGIYALRARLTGRKAEVERAKAAALGPSRRGPAVALNRVLERADRPGEPFEIPVADEEGSLGRIRVDGVRVEHLAALGDGSNALLAYFVRQAGEAIGVDAEELDVVAWKNIDEEGWHQYVGLVEALRALGRRVGGGVSPWPHASLSDEACASVERRLSAICGAARDEGFLPHVEFEGEHKIPIIPEPLGIVSLQRRERRVDPLSSMSSSLIVVAIVVALLVWFISRPPWVPGSG